MCGIAGYVGISAAWGLPLLRRMAAAQAHRGPDGEGIMVAGLTGLAHRRLAVIDRAGGAQPMYSSDGRFALVYNGEIYNYRELREELSAGGVRFTTASDTEVVLSAWIRWGEQAFDRFEGMFALAIADRKTGQVVLARDQFGIKPLHLASDGDGRTFFASEIKALLASGAVARVPDDETIYRYLRFRVHDDTERTFFAGITRLLPGELVVLRAAEPVERRRYTRLYDDLERLAASERPAPYDKAARGRFATALRDAVRARLVSDVPVGTALSGGLDSSTIVTSINQMLAESDQEAAGVGSRQRTFSAVFPGERNDEERYVDAVAERCGDSLRVHKVHPSPDRFLDDLPDFVRAQEEPVISTGPYAQYRVMREAAKHVTVMIDGQGADEMLAGYLPYYLVRLRQALRRRGTVRALIETVRSLDVLWRLGRFRLADRLSRRRPLELASLLSPEFSAANAWQRMPIIRDDLKRRLFDDLFRHSLPALLRYEDRNTMWFSVEGRVPFLDTTLLRTLWELDDSAITYGGLNKRALRDATFDLLPRLVHRRRDKIGFTTPEDAWFGRIKNDVYEVFNSASFGARPYFDQRAVLHAFRDYVAGRVETDTMTFWRLLNVELWLRAFIDDDPNRLPAGPAEATLTGEEPDGVHPQAPPKDDFTPNDGKSVLLTASSPSGEDSNANRPPTTWWARFPLRVDLIRVEDQIPELAAGRAGEFFAGLDGAPARARELTDGGPWYLFISEKVVAITQGRVYKIRDIRPTPPARLLSRYVARTPFGIGLGHPATMQLAIAEVGLPRILLAAAVALGGRVVGRRGLFYQVAGARVRAIDGPTRHSAYPANVSAKLAPKDPAGVARQVSAAVRASVPAHRAATFAGTVVIDANDLGQDILGHDADRPSSELAAAFADNPLCQERQQTPFAIVFAVPASVGSEAR